MSDGIDNRIVRMQFDNKQFEQGVGTTLKSLDNLKTGLQLDGISNNVEKIAGKFSALGIIGITALQNITNSAIETGKALVKSITLDPITDGFQEYELVLNAIQTTMAGTGKSLDYVETQLTRLDKYADDTVYSTSDMLSNLPKFTNAGVELEDATTAMIGIANATAVAGGDARSASIAFYNLGQSIGTGYLSRMDYNSINNAGIATMEWKNQMVDAAIAQGKLTKVGNDAYKAGNKTFTLQSLFIDGLQEQWASTEVMMKVFKDYGDVTTEIGKKSQASAQDLKTFTMMVESLQAQAGTGWKDTWQLLFGNLEEAKVLWTGLGNSIGGMISNAAKARNALLQGWSDLGGRTDLIETFKNVFAGIGSVIKPVKEAFRDIFPAMTAERLYKITKNLKEFTSKLILGKNESNLLKNTFKGLFAVVSLIGKAFKAVWNVIKPLFGGVKQLSGGILELTGRLGEWLTKLKESADDSKFFENIVKSIQYAISNLAEIMAKGIKKFKEWLSTLKEGVIIPGVESAIIALEKVAIWLGILKESSVTAFSKVKDGAKDGLGSANTLLERFSNFISGIKEGLSNFGSTVKEAFTKAKDTVKNALTPIVEAIKNMFSGVTLGEVVGAGLLGGFLIFLRKIYKKFTEIKSDLADVVNNVAELLDSARGALEAYQNNLNAGTLLKIAGAVGLLVAALIALTFVDPSKVYPALGALTILLAEMVGVLKILGSTGPKGALNTSQVRKSATSIVILSAAVSVLAGALAKMSVFSSGTDMLSAAGAIGILMAAMVAAVKAMSSGKNKINGGEFIKTSLALVIFSTAISRLASAMGKFAGMKPEELKQGLWAMGAMLAEIAIFIRLSKADQLKKTRNELIKTAVSLMILTQVVKILGGMDPTTLKVGLGAVGALLLMLATSVKLMNGVNMAGTATALLGIAVALTILVIPIKLLGNMDWESLARGLVGIGVTLALLVGTMALLKGGSFASTAASMILMALALTALVVPIKLLGNMPWQNLALGIGALAAILLIFTIAAYALAPISSILLTISGALVLFGISVLAIGAGVLALSLGLSALALISGASALAIVTALGIIILGVVALIPEIVKIIVDGIITFAKTLSDSIGIIMDAVKEIIKELLKTIVTLIPDIISTFGEIVIGILELVLEYKDKILTTFMTLLLGLIDAIIKNLPKLTAKGTDLVVGLLNGITKNLPKIVQAGFDMLLGFIDGITQAINNNTDSLIESMNNLVMAMINAAIKVIKGAFDLGKQIRDLGKNLIDGFIKGIKDKLTAVGNAVKDVGKKALNGLKGFLGIKSPSRVFMKLGEQTDEGFIKGLEGYSDKVGKASEGVGKEAVDGIKSSISKIADAVNSDIDAEPTIRPVLDLTDIQNGSKKIGDLMGGMSGTAKLAYNTSGDIQRKNARVLGNQIMTFDPPKNPGGENPVNNFYITGSNPKEIANEVSRILQKQVEKEQTAWA